MEDCKICYIKESNKKLPCCHEICSDCCVRLNSAICPFCRRNFTYTNDEIKERIKLGIINGYKVEVPPSLAFQNQNFLLTHNILPRDWINNRQLNLNNQEEIIHEPYSRAIKNSQRRRRRFLSLDEVLERRKEIKEKQARHWEKKNGRLNKYSNFFEM
jgi:hypothetical protein